jgi:hypothetical protein
MVEEVLIIYYSASASAGELFQGESLAASLGSRAADILI